MTRTAALKLPGAEVLSNGQCVGHLEYDERYGTVLVIDWHADGCEHVDTRKLDCGCVLGKYRTERMCRYHQAEDDAIYAENQRRLGYGESIGRVDYA